jgi:cytochrome c-type biogenesis protein CcmH/NrfG
LQVRKLERAAQLNLAALRRNVVAKLVRAVSSAPFILNATLKLKDDPRSALETAERLLRRDPHSVSALNLLGQAATELGWMETAIFAHQMASDLEPERIDLMISLGHAHLAGARLGDAENTANEALALQPNNSDAHKLLEAVLVASASAKWTQSAAGDARRLG